MTMQSRDVRQAARLRAARRATSAQTSASVSVRFRLATCAGGREDLRVLLPAMSSLALLALSFDDPLPLNSFFEGAALRATPAYAGGVCAAGRTRHCATADGTPGVEQCVLDTPLPASDGSIAPSVARWGRCLRTLHSPPPDSSALVNALIKLLAYLSAAAVASFALTKAALAVGYMALERRSAKS